MMARRGAPPPVVSDDRLSRLPERRDQRRPCCLDWPASCGSSAAAPISVSGAANAQPLPQQILGLLPPRVSADRAMLAHLKVAPNRDDG